MKRVHDDYLHDMLENAEKALSFVDDMDYDEFEIDDKAVYAVIRAFEIIGEAARQIPERMRKDNPDIPWREITGMRNKLTHEYFGVNTKVVWRTVYEDLPVIIPLLKKCWSNKTERLTTGQGQSRRHPTTHPARVWLHHKQLRKPDRPIQSVRFVNISRLAD